MTTTIRQSLTFIIFIVLEKIATLKFLLQTDHRTASQQAGCPLTSQTVISTYTHIFHYSQKRECLICSGNKKEQIKFHIHITFSNVFLFSSQTHFWQHKLVPLQKQNASIGEMKGFNLETTKARLTVEVS